MKNFMVFADIHCWNTNTKSIPRYYKGKFDRLPTFKDFLLIITKYKYCRIVNCIFNMNKVSFLIFLSVDSYGQNLVNKAFANYISNPNTPNRISKAARDEKNINFVLTF